MNGKWKKCLLCIALCAALLTGGAAAAGRAQQVRQQAPAAPGQTGGYLLQEEDGQVCIFRDGRRLAETEILPALLRQQDRAALQEGLHAEDLESLLKLIEDLDS